MKFFGIPHLHKMESNDARATFEALSRSTKVRHMQCEEIWEKIKDHKNTDYISAYGITRLVFNQNTLWVRRDELKIPFQSLKTHFEQVVNKFKDDLPDQV